MKRDEFEDEENIPADCRIEVEKLEEQKDEPEKTKLTLVQQTREEVDTAVSRCHKIIADLKNRNSFLDELCDQTAELGMRGRIFGKQTRDVSWDIRMKRMRFWLILATVISFFMLFMWLISGAR